MRVEIYSDVACPWCYVGEARFARALRAFPGAEAVEVVYRPYQLDPAAPTAAEPMLDYLERRFGPRARAMADRVVATARAEGLAMDFDRGLAVNTLAAHRLLRHVERERGAAVQRQVAEALFRAHFAEGRDVGDVDVLTAIAREAGLDGDAVRAHLASDADTPEVRAAIADAQALGVTAVPTFVFDGQWAVQGAQPTSTFLQVLERVAAESSRTPSSEPNADDASCADGACAL